MIGSDSFSFLGIISTHNSLSSGEIMVGNDSFSFRGDTLNLFNLLVFLLLNFANGALDSCLLSELLEDNDGKDDDA